MTSPRGCIIGKTYNRFGVTEPTKPLTTDMVYNIGGTPPVPNPTGSTQNADGSLDVPATRMLQPFYSNTVIPPVPTVGDVHCFECNVPVGVNEVIRLNEWEGVGPVLSSWGRVELVSTGGFYRITVVTPAVSVTTPDWLPTTSTARIYVTITIYTVSATEQRSTIIVHADDGNAVDFVWDTTYTEPIITSPLQYVSEVFQETNFTTAYMITDNGEGVRCFNEEQGPQEFVGDIKFFYEDPAPADIRINGENLVRDPGLENSILISLFSNGRADSRDAIPNEEDKLGGWWGDTLLETPFPSKLWTLGRTKINDTTIALVEQFTKDALGWMEEDRLADIISATATRTGVNIITTEVRIAQPGGSTIYFKYYVNWKLQTYGGA